MDFPIHLEAKSKVPVFRQLVAALEEAMLSGRLKPGDQLPPTRELAESLGVARGTVVRAYEELLSQGFLEGKTGLGTTVRKRVVTRAESPVQVEALTPALTRSLSSYAQRLMEVELVPSTSGDLPALNYGCAPQEILPIKQWRELILRHCRPQDTAELPYVTETFGHRPLREAISGYLQRTKGVRCGPDQVIVYSGSQPALNQIIDVLVERDDLVAVETPGYVGARTNLLAHGARLSPIPVDENGLNVDLLKSAREECKLVYASPSGQDPTGVVLSNDRRIELLKWANRNDRMIIEDAWDTDYRYGGTAVPSLQGMSDGRCVIYLYTFWKLLFPLTSLSVVVVPVDLIPVFTRAKHLTERQFPALEYYALTDFINAGYLELHIKRSRKIYQARRQAVIYALSTCFGRAVSVSPRSAGLHLLTRFTMDKTEDEILEASLKADLPVVSTKLYYVSDPAPMEFLIPFSCIAAEAASERITKLAELLR